MRERFGKDVPLPKLGEVSKKSRVQVIYIFTYKDLNGSTKYGKLQFTNPTTGEKQTTYGYWEDVIPNLKEGSLGASS